MRISCATCSDAGRVPSHNLPELIFRRTGVKAGMAKDAPYCVAKGTGEALKHLDVYKKAIISKR